MDIKTALKYLTERRHLKPAEMTAVMQAVMSGECTPAQIAGFLIALRMKGETVEEITAAAQVMRSLATPVNIQSRRHLIDIVGTGGDGQHTFNISTTSTFLVAAAGGQVAKHGNRSVSSSSGSADVLEALGVNLQLNAAQVQHCVEKIGLGFMFAPNHHNAMKHAIQPRREMGVRTLFNLLGPLTNPANAPYMLLGVFGKEWIEPVAHVMAKLQAEHVLVVHSEDGLDEISIAAPTYIAELVNGAVQILTITPEMFGLQRAPLELIRVSSVAESVAFVKGVLDNQTTTAAQQAARDIVLLNAGAAIYAANLVDSLTTGVELAQEMLSSGLAKQKLAELVALTQTFK